jgi:Zn-dependent protease with chaperone function
LKRIIFGLFLCLGLAAFCPATPAQEQTTPNPPAAYHLPADKQQKAQELNRAAHWLHFGSELWTLGVLWVFLATGAAAKLGASIVRKGRRGWLNSAIFSALLTTLVFLAVEMPPWIVGHALSLKYGISIQPWLSWVQDCSVSFRLAVLSGTFIFMLAYFLVCKSPRHYWLWLAGALIPFTVFGAFVLPILIDPMYNKSDELAETHPALVTQLERVVARTGTSIPPDRMYMVRVASKSNGLNAKVTGLGASKRIVIWDTTADRMPTDEILFVFAHESGHYVLNHIVKGLVLAAGGMFALFWLTAILADFLLRHFGASWNIPSLATLPGMVVLLLALTFMQYLTEPIANSISRFFEHEADVYGQEAIHGLVPDPQKTAVAAFNLMGQTDLDDPSPSPFIEFWTYDHPSIQTRATFAAQYDPWAPGQKPRFFTK